MAYAGGVEILVTFTYQIVACPLYSPYFWTLSWLTMPGMACIEKIEDGSEK